MMALGRQAQTCPGICMAARLRRLLMRKQASDTERFTAVTVSSIKLCSTDKLFTETMRQEGLGAAVVCLEICVRDITAHTHDTTGHVTSE